MRWPHKRGSFFIVTLLCLSLQMLDPRAAVLSRQADDLRPQTTAHGIELYNEGNTQAASKVLEKVVKKHPDDADAWYYLGLAFYKEGSIGAARPAFERLLKLGPNSADGNAKLSYALILANEPVNAMLTAKRAIELGDQSAEPHYALAEACLYFRVREGERAVEEADRALILNPSFSPALVTKSLAHYHLKQYAEAAAALEKLLALSPNDLDADIWRAQMEQMRSLALESQVDATRSSVSPASETKPMSSKDVNVRARVLTKPEPKYTEAARKAQVQGTVLLQCVFSKDGEIKNMLVLKSLGYGLTTTAITSARNIHFTPAMKDGVPVSTYMRLEYNFNLY